MKGHRSLNILLMRKINKKSHPEGKEILKNYAVKKIAYFQN